MDFFFTVETLPTKVKYFNNSSKKKSLKNGIACLLKGKLLRRIIVNINYGKRIVYVNTVVVAQLYKKDLCKTYVIYLNRYLRERMMDGNKCFM